MKRHGTGPMTTAAIGGATMTAGGEMVLSDGSQFVPYQWIPRPWPVFHCAKCKAEHPCPPRDEWGVWPFPASTATTERGPDGEWRVVCVGCAEVRS